MVEKPHISLQMPSSSTLKKLFTHSNIRKLNFEKNCWIYFNNRTIRGSKIWTDIDKI